MSSAKQAKGADLSPSTLHREGSIKEQLLEAHSILVNLERSWEALQGRWGETLASSSRAEVTPNKTLSTQDLYEQINAQTPLRLLLLGGSGVGKSTLLNALAGHEISSTSSLLRAHTSHLVIYTHHTWSSTPIAQLVPSWSPELCDSSERVVHRSEALRDQWVIDAPDVDSTQLLHRGRALEALSETDLPVIVTSPQKYRDADCTKMLRFINPQRPILFVMTQLDEVWPEQRAELMRDLYALCAELKLRDVRWVGLDAKRDAIQPESEGFEPLSLDEARWKKTLFGVESLKRVIADQLTQNERERLRAGRFAQRISERAMQMRVPRSALDELRSLRGSYESLTEVLSPLIYHYLNLAITRQREREVARLDELFDNAQGAPGQSRPAWYIRLTTWPIRVIWSWTLLRVKERAMNLGRISRERESMLTCCASLVRPNLNTSISPSSGSSASASKLPRLTLTGEDVVRVQASAKGLLEATVQADSAQLAHTSPPLNLLSLSVRIIGLSIAISVLFSIFGASLFFATSTGLITCFGFAQRSLKSIQIRRGIGERTLPDLYRLTNKLVAELALLPLATHPRWRAFQSDSERSPSELIERFEDLEAMITRHHQASDRLRSMTEVILSAQNSQTDQATDEDS